MSEVARALEALIAQHNRIGSPVGEFLIEGRPREEIRDRLRAIGLDPADDLVDFFGFQDGIASSVWRREYGGAAELYLYPFYSSPTVEQAEERYRVCRSGSVDAYGHEPRREGDIPAVGYWARTWFPIFIGDYILAADSRGGSVSPVWGRASHPGRLTQRLHQGIAELLRDVTDRFQRGAYAWREDLSDFEENTDLTRMDAALRPQASVTDPFTDY